jgi:hypothetical protein
MIGIQEALVIHVTFSSSGAGSLRQALRLRDQRNKVLDITDDLSWGPIVRGDFVEREAWLNLNLPWEPNSPVDGVCWDWIATGAQDFQKKLESSDEHLVWVAPQNAGELCGLHWYLDRFAGHKASFIVVDHGFPGTWQGQAPRGIGELGPEQFEFLLENADRKAWDVQRFPRCRWAQLCNGATNLRIVNKGVAASVPDDFFDDAILAQFSTEWRRLHRVIADAMIAMWESHHSIDDSFIMWRLRELGSSGRVVANRAITVNCFKPDDPVLVRLS